METRLNTYSDNPTSLWKQQSIHAATRRQHSEITEQSPGDILAIKQSQHKQKQSTLHTSQNTDPTQSYMPWMWHKTTPGGCKACSAYNQLCHYCHKAGHYARVCQAKLSQQANPQAPTWSIHLHQLKAYIHSQK